MIFFIVICVTLVSSIDTATIKNRTGHLRVIGAYFADIEKVPFMVLLLSKKNSQPKCSGSIIDENWVLTAAHCFSHQKLDDIEVVAGIDDMDVTEDIQKRKILQIISHPLYRNAGQHWDIALVKVLKFDFSSKKVAILELGNDPWPLDGQQYNRKCTIVGWGLATLKDSDISTTTPSTMINTRLHMTEVIAEHGNQACKCLHQYKKIRFVCLKNEEGKGLCSGDSGGPLVCDNKAYGIAHGFYQISRCTLQDFARDSGTCDHKTNINLYTYTCPLLNWMRKYVRSVPPRPFSCKASSVFKSIILQVIILFLTLYHCIV